MSSLHNYKKTHNYSSLIGEIKSSSINDKIKGRNYKMYMKRNVTNSVDKQEITGMKSVYGANSNYMSTVHDQSINKAEKSVQDLGNKIDIKISVNYGKPGHSHTVMNSGANNTGVSSNLSTSKAPDYLHTNNDKHSLVSSQIKDKLIKSLKSTISDEKIIRKKLNDSRHQTESNNKSANLNNSHKRNQSDINYYQNNLNISLMNYDNKPIINYYNNSTNTHSKQATNHNTINTKGSSNPSFAFNQHLFNHISEVTPKCKDVPVTLENNPKIETLENINIGENLTTMNDFTLNRNDNNFMNAVNTINSMNTVNTNSINTVTSPSSSFGKKEVLQLEKKLEDALTSVVKEKESDKMLMMSKKYSIYKKTFEDFIKLLDKDGSPTVDIATKINEGYNETLQTVILSYSKVKEKIGDYDLLAKNFKNVSTKYNELYKSYQEKSDEVKVLKLKLAQYEENTLNVNNANLNSHNNVLRTPPNKKVNPSIHSNMSSLNAVASDTTINKQTNTQTKGTVATATESNELNIGINRNRVISMINQNLVDDLDAICFFDKINMRSNSTTHSNVPKLDLNFLNMRKKKEESSTNVSNNVSNNMSNNMSKISNNVSNNFKGSYNNSNNKSGIKNIQPLKLDDLSVGGDNKLISSAYNSVVNKNQSLYKPNISYHSSVGKKLFK